MVTTFRYCTVERVDGRTQSVWSQVVPNPLWCSRCSLLTRYWLATNSLLWCAAAAVSHVAAVAAWRACLRLLTNNWSNHMFRLWCLFWVSFQRWWCFSTIEFLTNFFLRTARSVSWSDFFHNMSNKFCNVLCEWFRKICSVPRINTVSLILKKI